MRGALLALMLTATAGSALAQGGAGEMLREAKSRYDALDMERANLLLRQLVSPGASLQVNAAQRAEAYKYLAASLAFEGKRDSAVSYFRAAIERDPLVDLDPLTFTPGQIAALEEARRSTFALALQALQPGRIDPGTERFAFTVFTTHAATLRVEVRRSGTSDAALLFSGPSDHLREISWNGFATGDQLAPAGRYELVVLGKSALNAGADSTAAHFYLEQEHAALEDTLPDLAPEALLPERSSRSSAAGDLARGLGVAAAALLISTLAADGDLDGDARVLTGVAGGAGLATGLFLFAVGSREHPIAKNLKENMRRRDERAAANAAIQQRNQERVAHARLMLIPAAGAVR